MKTDARHADKRPLRCFISAAAGTDLATLRSVLARLGVQCTAADSLPLAMPIVAAIREAIASSDFVVVVVPSEVRAAAPLFEAGIALGTGKPLVAIACPEVQLPWDAGSALTIRSSSDDDEALTFNLRHFLRNTSFARRRRLPKHRAPRRQTRMRDLLLKLDAASDRDLGNIVVEALERLPEIKVKRERAAEGAMADLVAWAEDLRAGLNPVMVEIKGAGLPADRLHTAVDQLACRARKAGAGTALLLVKDLPRTGMPVHWTPPPAWLLVIDLREFLERIEGRPFDAVLVEYRNQLAHRVP